MFEVIPGTLGAEYNEMCRDEDVVREGDEFIQLNSRPFDDGAMSGLLSFEIGFLLFSVRRSLENDVRWMRHHSRRQVQTVR